MHYGFVIVNLWTGKILTANERWTDGETLPPRWTREHCRRWVKRYQAKHPKAILKVTRVTIPYLRFEEE